MADIGFQVSPQGVDARTAAAIEQAFTSEWPQAKLDKSKTESFRNIGLTFNSNTPDGVKTEVYKFKHGYKYRPDIWLSGQSGTVGVGIMPYWQDSGQFAFGANIFETAQFSWEADDEYVYFYVARSVVSIVNIRLLIRVYVFVDDVGL